MTARLLVVAMLLVLAPLGGCGRAAQDAATPGAGHATIPLTIERTGEGAGDSIGGGGDGGGGRRHAFRVEVAKTPAQQQQGLMFRAELAPDAGMLFAPYPPGGGEPRIASFWMKDTPHPLDIIFIRADHTIASVAENAVPLSQAPVSSREPVAAVLELRGGRAAELGIGEGDTVRW